MAVENRILSFPGTENDTPQPVESSFPLNADQTQRIAITRYPLAGHRKIVHHQDSADIRLETGDLEVVLHFQDLLHDADTQILLSTNPREEEGRFYEEKGDIPNKTGRYILMRDIQAPADVLRLLYFIGYVNTEDSIKMPRSVSKDSLERHMLQIGQGLHMEHRAWWNVRDMIHTLQDDHGVDIAGSVPSYKRVEQRHIQAAERSLVRDACEILSRPGAQKSIDLKEFRKAIDALPWSDAIQEEIPEWLKKALYARRQNSISEIDEVTQADRQPRDNGIVLFDFTQNRPGA